MSIICPGWLRRWVHRRQTRRLVRMWSADYGETVASICAAYRVPPAVIGAPKISAPRSIP